MGLAGKAESGRCCRNTGGYCFRPSYKCSVTWAGCCYRKAGGKQRGGSWTVGACWAEGGPEDCVKPGIYREFLF